jgi:hypothetical protein
MREICGGLIWRCIVGCIEEAKTMANLFGAVRRAVSRGLVDQAVGQA